MFSTAPVFQYADKKMDLIKIGIVFFTVCAVIGLGASVKSFFELWNDKDEDK
jgi:hypothetical protein